MNLAKKMPNSECPEVWLTRLENTTGGVDLLHLKSSESLTKVASVFPHGFQILLPNGACPVGHIVIIDFTMLFGQRRHHMEATGKVVSVNESGNETLVDVEFRRFDRKLWNELLELISARQENVNRIFSVIKGEQ